MSPCKSIMIRHLICQHSCTIFLVWPVGLGFFDCFDISGTMILIPWQTPTGNHASKIMRLAIRWLEQCLLSLAGVLAIRVLSSASSKLCVPKASALSTKASSPSGHAWHHGLSLSGSPMKSSGGLLVSNLFKVAPSIALTEVQPSWDQEHTAHTNLSFFSCTLGKWVPGY